MPWVRLHATKDYLDMLQRLDATPSIHQTFNMVPSLVDQLEEYLPPANRSDEFLDHSRRPAAALSSEEQRFLLRWFFLASPDRMIRPFPRYHDLLMKRGVQADEEAWPRIQKRFHVQDYLDLQVWFNLVWIDPWLRAQDQNLMQLTTKGAQFTEEEKHYVLDQHLALLARVIPAYRAAAASGQIEISTSPYYHPILPLLCDTREAKMALPQLPLPATSFRHPEDARWQLEQGLRRHEAVFGAPPIGVWPSEGSVSESVARLAIESRVGWMATDEEILWRTLKTARSAELLYRPHRVSRANGQLAMVFRDRELSDLLGFVYSQWDCRVAVADFVKRLERIHQHVQGWEQPALVSIILDGENAWEFYPNDAHDFLTCLYQALERDERFQCVTVSEFLQHYSLELTPSLPELFSGSWIDGNFATWVGHPEKNVAWEHLSRAREALEPFRKSEGTAQRAWASFGAAEGSDWMWWFGDTHFSAQAAEFDRLFRMHAINAYQFAGLAVPPELYKPIRRVTCQPLYGPTGLIHPTIDGRETSYYEWLYAGKIDLKRQYSSIHRGEQCLLALFYGSDRTNLYLRVDLDVAALDRVPSWTIELLCGSEGSVEVAPRPDYSATHRVQAKVRLPEPVELPCALNRLLELSIPFEQLRCKDGERIYLAATLHQEGEVLERYPAQGAFELIVSSRDVEAQAWSV